MAKKKETNDVPKQPVFINPLTDFGFRRIFSDKELLISFLNEVLPTVKIIDVSYEPTTVIGEIKEDRTAVYDLLCKNESKDYILIEMQCARQPYFADRALFYGAHLIRKQAKKGKWNFNIKAVYVVSILNFRLKKSDKELIIRVSLMDEKTRKQFSDKLNFTYIQLPNFKKDLSELSGNFDNWMYSLRFIEKLANKPAEVQGRIFEKLFEMLQIKQLNSEEMEAYNRDILKYNDVQSAVQFAREEALIEGEKLGERRGIRLGKQRGIKLGEQRGIKLGEQRGIKLGEQRGIKVGESRGIKIGQESLLLSMYANGMTIDAIHEISKIPLNELKKLLK